MIEGVDISRIRAGEWAELRELRLAALADAPMAFGSTLAREQALDDSVWQERVQTGAAGVERATFIARAGQRWVGSATGVREWQGRGARPAWIVGMWVHPDVRRQGVARSLLSAVAAWARDGGADVLNLDVTETNAGAIALYERLGFRPSGDTSPLDHTPSLRELRMFCPVADFAGPRTL